MCVVCGCIQHVVSTSFIPTAMDCKIGRQIPFKNLLLVSKITQIGHPQVTLFWELLT